MQHIQTSWYLPLNLQAEEEAKQLKDEYVSVEHLLLSLVEEGSQTVAGRILQS